MSGKRVYMFFLNNFKTDFNVFLQFLAHSIPMVRVKFAFEIYSSLCSANVIMTSLSILYHIPVIFN